jgi:membrane-bound metal-dependent hydrolase YbcI (DUF457 family)
MEPVTHALAAIALSRAGLNRLAPRATPILIAAALAPDLDLASVAGGAGSYLRWHRTLFHSLIGGLTLALVLAVVATLILRRSRTTGEFASASFSSLRTACGYSGRSAGAGKAGISRRISIR